MLELCKERPPGFRAEKFDAAEMQAEIATPLHVLLAAYSLLPLVIVEARADCIRQDAWSQAAIIWGFALFINK